MAGKEARGTAPRRNGSTPLARSFACRSTACLLLALGWLTSPVVLGQTAPPRGTPAAAPAVPAGPQAAPAPAAAKPATPVMAVVNGEQISRDVLAQECLRRYGSEVLDSTINRQLIQLACQARNVTVSEKDVTDEIQVIAAKFGLSVDQWLSVLETERNIDAAQYRREIIWPMLALRRMASSQVVATDEEVRQAFESEYGPRVKARLIAVSSRQKAEQLLKLVQADPNSFPRVAKEHSEDRGSAAAYGVIPPIRMHLGDANLENAAFQLRDGQVSPIVQVGNQYLILKCDQQIPRSMVSGEQLPEIQKRLRTRIVEQKMRVESASLFQQLQSQAQIVKVFGDPKLAAQYPGVAAVINSRPLTMQQLADECLARNGKDVLEGEIHRLLLIQELQRKGRKVEEADIDREVARAAEVYGFLKADGSPDIDAWLKQVTEGDQTTVELYIRDAVWPSVALKKLVDGSVQITNEDLQKGFEANFGERVEVLAVVLGSQRQAQTVWEMARNNPTDQFFGELAHQYSIEPTSRANFGKVPPLRQHGGQPTVEKEAFRLQAGELSGIIAVGDKYVILRCLGRTKPVVTDINLVKGELVKDIQEKKLRLEMAKEFDRLREVSQIDNFLAGTSQAGKYIGGPTASRASFEQPVPATRPAAAPPVRR